MTMSVSGLVLMLSMLAIAWYIVLPPEVSELLYGTRDMEIELKRYDSFSEELVEIMYSREVAVFKEPYSKAKLRRESSTRPSLMSLVAFGNGRAVGYKVGYEMTSRLFYS